MYNKGMVFSFGDFNYSKVLIENIEDFFMMSSVKVLNILNCICMCK